MAKRKKRRSAKKSPGKKRSARKAPARTPSPSRQGSKGWAFVGVLLTLIGFLLVMMTRKNDKYAMYYGKQGLIIFISWAIVGIVGTVVPIIGWVIILPIGNILMFILWLMALANSLSGKTKPTPIIGKFAEKIKI